ncbi:unnamed protein product [Rotaria sordida]|uniref:ATP-grasp domain-containing protein n=1 Tax=Rotaria sordida TaxID=392033 RepID=A0A814FGG0_9BILA|nr:unnamed protein product [Rotaria sordida]CAF3800824.1 unnamed protein product [Rotaria sordida]
MDNECTINSVSTADNEYSTGSKYIVIPQQSDYTSKLLLGLSKRPSIQLCHHGEFGQLNSPIKESDKLYLSSDTLFPLIQSKLTNSQSKIIETFRNKFLFRELLKYRFVDYFYDTTDLSELSQYKFNFTKCGKYIIKPCTGFMGAGVRIIDRHTNLHEVCQALENELKTFSKHYPNVFSSKFLIEEYIESPNEYAVDIYYDNQGLPVVINIYCHPDAKRKEYLQMLYYTSAEIFELLYDKILDFFTQLNDRLHLTSFPIHAEFKMDSSNQLFPLEFNPARFGGMGLADLTYYSFHFHAVQAFFRNEKPDWKEIWEKNPKKIFCWILGYNAADKNITLYEPDHELFKQLLPHHVCLLNYEELDYQTSPAFAIVYLSTENKEDIQSILDIEFNDCFVLKREKVKVKSRSKLCEIL